MPGARDADVVVVGAGLAGLAAATFLARGGAKVVVFEKADAAGGRARTRTLDGFSFNIGGHALYRTGRGATVLRELGVCFDGGSPSLSGAYASRKGVLHTLPMGPVSMLTTGLLTAREKLEAARVLVGMRGCDTEDLHRVTLDRWLLDKVEHLAVRELAAALIRLTTYVDDAVRLSAAAGLAQLRLAGEGVLYLHGGWQTLVDGLRHAAEAAGVSILTHTPVLSVLRGPAVSGVQLEGGNTITARAVLVASSPGAAAELASGACATVLEDWAARATPVRAACLDVALDELPRPTATLVLGMDEPLYLSVHSAVARLGPQGTALIHLVRYGGLRNDSAEVVERRLMALLDVAQPGWRQRVVHQRFLPDTVVTNALSAAEQGGTPGRPGPGVPDAPGFYVAGDWVGTEGILADASLASAKAAAQGILNDLRRASATA